MTATMLLIDLNRSGIRLAARGDRLHVEAKPGAITDDLRRLLTEHKAELLAELLKPTDMRAHLHCIATDAGLPAAIVHDLHHDDVGACAGLPMATLRDYLRAQDFGRMMDRGIPPPGYTKAVECSGCGPVLLWQSSPDRVIACPWCFRRKAGKAIPRPSAFDDDKVTTA